MNNNFRNKIDTRTGRDQKLLKQPYFIQKDFEMWGKREVWVETLDTCRESCFMFCLAQAFQHIIKRTKSSHKINHFCMTSMILVSCLHELTSTWTHGRSSGLPTLKYLYL